MSKRRTVYLPPGIYGVGLLRMMFGDAKIVITGDGRPPKPPNRRRGRKKRHRGLT